MKFEWATLGRNARITWRYAAFSHYSRTTLWNEWIIHFLDEICDRLLLKYVARVSEYTLIIIAHFYIIIINFFRFRNIRVYIHVTYMNVLYNNKLCWYSIHSHVYRLNELMSLCALCTHISYIYIYSVGCRLSLNFVCVMCISHPLCATFV